MAFSALTHLTTGQFNSLNGLLHFPNFNKTPEQSQVGTPDPGVTIDLNGWGNNTMMIFTVNTSYSGILNLCIDNLNPRTIIIDINGVGNENCQVVNPITTPTYWSVDLGTDDNRNSNQGTSPPDWSIAFSISANNRPAGGYLFVKGRVKKK